MSSALPATGAGHNKALPSPSRPCDREAASRKYEPALIGAPDPLDMRRLWAARAGRAAALLRSVAPGATGSGEGRRGRPLRSVWNRLEFVAEDQPRPMEDRSEEPGPTRWEWWDPLPTSDPQLEYLVLLAAIGLGRSITLLVSGMLITGRLTTAGDAFAVAADQWRSAVST